MHIPEGIVTSPVLIGGATVAAAGVVYGLHTMTDRQMVKVAVLSSAFFVASLIHVPIGAGSMHLVLAGLTGVLLGPAVFPAVAVALLLQASLFGMGGLTTLGVNTVVMAVPGFIVYLLFARAVSGADSRFAFGYGCAAGMLALFLAAALQSATLVLSGREFAVAAGAVLVAHVPVMIIEGLVTGWAVVFLRKVRPDTFHLFEAPVLVVEQTAAP